MQDNKKNKKKTQKIKDGNKKKIKGNNVKNNHIINTIIKNNSLIHQYMGYLLFFVRQNKEQTKMFKQFRKDIKKINTNLMSIQKQTLKDDMIKNISNIQKNLENAGEDAGKISEIIKAKKDIVWQPNIEFTKKLCKEIKSNIAQNLESINKIKTQDIAK